MSIDMTFWRRFAPDILSGKKTITIRDKRESAFAPGDVLRVGYDDDGQYFCTLVIEQVTPTEISQLTEAHAHQENMTLAALRDVLAEIYPEETQLYVLAFHVLETA